MKNLNLFKSYGRKLAHFKLKHGRNKCPQFCTVNSPPVGTKFRVPLAQLKEHPQQLFLALRQLFLAQLREIFFGTTVPKGSKKQLHSGIHRISRSLEQKQGDVAENNRFTHIATTLSSLALSGVHHGDGALAGRGLCRRNRAVPPQQRAAAAADGSGEQHRRGAHQLLQRGDTGCRGAHQLLQRGVTGRRGAQRFWEICFSRRRRRRRGVLTAR